MVRIEEGVVGWGVKGEKIVWCLMVRLMLLVVVRVGVVRVVVMWLCVVRRLWNVRVCSVGIGVDLG